MLASMLTNSDLKKQPQDGRQFRIELTQDDRGDSRNI